MPDTVSSSPVTIANILAPGIAAVRKFWRPFLLLQAAGLFLVVAYYSSDRVRLACDRLSQFKQHSGLIFTMIAAAVAGALMPELAKAIVMGDRKITRQRLRDVGFALVVFALNGVITDFQYRGIGWLLGTDAHFSTVLRKVIFDQFVTTPLFGVPYWVVVYLIRANRYNLLKTAGQLTPRWYVTRVMPLLVPCWFYWVPMVSLVYALPASLQFCMYCFAAAAWSLVMIFIASHEAEETSLEVSTPAA